jgi:uncharacterized protein
MEQDLREKELKLEEGLETVKMQSLVKMVLEEILVLVLEDVREVLKKDKMSRPCKRRRVRGRPNSSYFKPAGVKLVEIEESSLSLSEFEAIRLVDLEEISQEDAGIKMDISQSTLSRILKSGRKKIADAIVNGKAIKIE